MKALILGWLVSAVSIVVASWLVGLVLPGDFVVKVGSLPDFLALLAGAALLAVANATIGTVLKLATLPLNCLTFGLAAFLVNAAVLFWVGQIGIGFHIKSFWAAVLGSLLLSATKAALSPLAKGDHG
jgi:putative membrane protein